MEKVFEYIKNQKKHHAKKTFQEEYDAFLKIHDMNENGWNHLIGTQPPIAHELIRGLWGIGKLTPCCISWNLTFLWCKAFLEGVLSKAKKLEEEAIAMEKEVLAIVEGKIS